MNRPEFPSDFMILVVSSISSFEMNKVNPVSALTAHHLLIFLSTFSVTEEGALVANLDKTFLTKRTVRSISDFLHKFLVIFLDCLTNSICSIAFGLAFNSFCLLKSTAINL